MEIIGFGLFNEEAINSSPSNQDCKENIMLQKENNMLSYLPDKLKKQILVESFIQLKVAVEHDCHMCPETDVLKHLQLLICLLEEFEHQGKLRDVKLSSELWPSVFQTKYESIYELCQCVFSDVCLPLIKCEGMKKSLLTSVLSLCSICVVCSAIIQQQVFIKLLVDLIHKETELLKRLLLVDCLSNTYSRVDIVWSEVSDHILNGIKKIFSTDEDPIVGNLLMVLLPKISEKLSNTNKLQQEMWTIIESCFCTIQQSDSSQSRAFMLLCGMVDIFFPASGCQPFVVSLLQTSDFWSRLQLGFLHPDQLTRKRVLFLFRRILDCTSKTLDHSDVGCWQDFPLFEAKNQNKMQDIWNEFLLIIETLEEKQIHVIQPVLDRFDVLLQATVKDESGIAHLHCSWILLLFRRMASHESAVIRRWAMGTLLKVDCSSFASDDKNLEFFYGPFIQMLSDSSVYYKCKDLEGGETSVELAIPEFFRNFHCCLSENKRKWFWTSFFESLSAHFWNGGVLVYVARALAEVPVCRILGAQSVRHFRKLLSLTVLAHDVVFRSVIQCFLTKTFFNLVDLSEVGVDMLLVILGCLKMPETLCRGNSLWGFLVEWLRSADPVWQSSDLLPKVEASVVAWLQSSTDLSEVKEDLTVIPDCLATVHFLLLTLDAGLHSTAEGVDCRTNQSILHDRLSSVLDIVNSVNSRAYLSEVKVHQALLMVLVLLKELEFQHDKSPDDEIYSMATKLMSELAEEILIFVVRKLMSVSKVCDYNPVPLYLALITCLARVAGHQIVMNSSSIQHLLNRYLTILSSDCSKSCSLSACVGLEVIGLICSLLPSATVSCDVCSRCQPLAEELKKLFNGTWTFKTQFNHFKEEEEEAEGHSSIIRCLRSNLLSSQWLVLSWCFCQRSSEVMQDVLEECVAVAQETLDAATPESLVSCLKALTPLLPKLADDRAAAVLEMVWNRVKELMRKSSFWPVYDVFLELTFQNSLMQCTPELETSKFLTKCFDDILRKSEEKSGMLNVLIHRICIEVSEHPDGMLSLIGLVPCVAKALAFGPIHDKAKRFHVEVEHFLNNLKDHFTEDDLKVRVVREDALVRVELLSFLARLSPSCSAHQEFGQRLVRHLVTSLRTVLDSQHRSYANCMTHRIKHRILVAMLVLEPFVKGDIASFAEFVLELVSKESQPSVRFFGEWMFIRLVQFQPQISNLLWNVLEKSSEKKPTVICSLLVMVVHVTELHLSTDKTQVSVLQKALMSILLFCLSSNFNVRAFAQAALLRLWKKATELMDHGLIGSCCEVMEYVHSYMNNNKDSFWAAFQLLDTHYCFNFDQQHDFAIETFVHIIPCLSGITDEEWLSMQSFMSVDPTWNRSGVHNLPLYSQSDRLKQLIARGWKTKITDVSSDVGVAAVPFGCSGNLQKKMVPWQSLLTLPGDDLEELNLNDHSSRSSSRSTDSLVLVTSLIDRIPNLGGLCRTCEIFGVSKFIIGSMRYLEDKTFEMLSVTSHKWINIEEVLPNCLVKYLLEMKKAGYVVVGAEQSTKSQCLAKFQFPKKTLLLLGNERYGIPVEILQVLDVCVEIPQSGMIRSLNVHVTGALLIWEYYKQWNLADGPSIPSTG